MPLDVQLQSTHGMKEENGSRIYQHFVASPIILK